MPYKAKVHIAHNTFTCEQGKKVSNCPPSLLRQFIKDGIVEMDGDPDEPEEGFEGAFEDSLSNFDRQELFAIIRANGLKNSIPVAKSWSDEQIRTAIREVADVSKLKLPGVASTEELNSGSSGTSSQL